MPRYATTSNQSGTDQVVASITMYGFRDGKMHGRGAYTWASGDRYDGEFRDGKPTVEGICTQADGSRFRGPC